MWNKPAPGSPQRKIIITGAGQFEHEEIHSYHKAALLPARRFHSERMGTSQPGSEAAKTTLRSRNAKMVDPGTPGRQERRGQTLARQP